METLVKNSFITYHKGCAYLLLPIRLLLTFLIIFTGVICITFTNNIIFNDKLSKRVIDYTVDSLIYTMGLNIRYIEDENYKNYFKNNEYSDRNFIYVFNHIHFFDSLILYKTLCRENILSTVMVKHMAEQFPISIIFRMSQSISISRDEKSGAVDKIKERLFRKRNVIIAPDSCQDPGDKLIAPFKTGAFAPDHLILPLIIRYIPSTDRNLVWNRNNHTDLDHFRNIFLDGHIEGHIRILDFESPKHNGDIKKFRDHVYNNMTTELGKMPSSYPGRVNMDNYKYDDPFYSLVNLTLYIYPFTMYGLHYNNYSILLINLLLFITGFFKYNYPTNNTKMFHIIYMKFALMTYYHMGLFTYMNLLYMCGYTLFVAYFTNHINI